MYKGILTLIDSEILKSLDHMPNIIIWVLLISIMHFNVKVIAKPPPWCHHWMLDLLSDSTLVLSNMAYVYWFIYSSIFFQYIAQGVRQYGQMSINVYHSSEWRLTVQHWRYSVNWYKTDQNAHYHKALHCGLIIHGWSSMYWYPNWLLKWSFEY